MKKGYRILSKLASYTLNKPKQFFSLTVLFLIILFSLFYFFYDSTEIEDSEAQIAVSVLSFSEVQTRSLTTTQKSRLTKLSQDGLFTKSKILSIGSVSQIPKASEIRIPLFDGSTLKMTRSSLKNNNENVQVWISEESTNGINKISGLAMKNTAVIGGINTSKGTYSIYPLGGDKVLFAELNVQNIKTDIVLEPPSADVVSITKEQLSGSTRTTNNTNSIIRVLVPYTKSAIDYVGSKDALDAMIALEITVSNYSFQYSKISITLELAGIELVNGTEVSTYCGVNLGRLRVEGDGYFDGIDVLRNKHKADIVMAIMQFDNNDCGGIAWLGPSDKYAYGFILAESKFPYVAFIHETGHLLGSYHDRSISQNLKFPYGHGMIVPSRNVATIMAYVSNSACTNSRCEYIHYFSNPRLSYFGAPMGTVDNEDNSRLFNVTGPSVMKFRPEPIRCDSVCNSDSVCQEANSSWFCSQQYNYNAWTDDSAYLGTINYTENGITKSDSGTNYGLNQYVENGITNQHLVKSNKLYYRTNTPGQGWSPWTNVTQHISNVGCDIFADCGGSIVGFNSYLKPDGKTEQHVLRRNATSYKIFTRNNDNGWSKWTDVTSHTSSVGSGQMTSFTSFVHKDGYIVQNIVRGGVLWERTNLGGWKPWAKNNGLSSCVGTTSGKCGSTTLVSYEKSLLSNGDEVLHIFRDGNKNYSRVATPLEERCRSKSNIWSNTCQ